MSPLDRFNQALDRMASRVMRSGSTFALVLAGTYALIWAVLFGII